MSVLAPILGRMSIPNLPQEKLVQEDGHIHPMWRKFFTQLITPLQQNLSAEGYTVPAQGGSQFTTLNNSNSKQRLLFNSDNSALMMNNGTQYETVVGATGAKTGVPEQTTVGAAGAAAPPPASPQSYWNINVNGTQYALPLYLPS